MAFKLFLLLILAVAIASVKARIVSPDRSGTITPIASSNNHNTITSQAQYSYAYNVGDTLTGHSKVHHDIRDGDALRGSYFFVEPNGNRRFVHYTADAVNGLNAIVHKQSGSANGQSISSPHASIARASVAPSPSTPVVNHQQLLLAPSIYPHQIHAVGNGPIGQQLQPVLQSHRPIVSVPTAPAVMRHPYTGYQSRTPKISVPTASAILRPPVTMLQKSHIQSTIIPYTQTIGAYQPSHSMSHIETPVFVVQPFTWYGEPHHSSTISPINPINKHSGMLPVVRVPTATIRPSAPAYGKLPSSHPNAIHREEPTPYLNSGIRPVILGRYGYALTNAPFKLKHN